MAERINQEQVAASGAAARKSARLSTARGLHRGRRWVRSSRVARAAAALAVVVSVAMAGTALPASAAMNGKSWASNFGIGSSTDGSSWAGTLAGQADEGSILAGKSWALMTPPDNDVI